jgi:hypothetical protein
MKALKFQHRVTRTRVNGCKLLELGWLCCLLWIRRVLVHLRWPAAGPNRPPSAASPGGAMAPATAGAVFLGLVLQRLRRFRIEPRRGNSKARRYFGGVGPSSCTARCYRFSRAPAARRPTIFTGDSIAPWQVQSASPSDVIATQHPDLLRIMRSDSSRITLRRPEISGDTLYGTTGRNSQRVGTRTGVALAEVEHVAVRRQSGTKTAALVGVSVAAATFGVLCFTTAGLCFPEGD